ncbi:MAG: glycosyltransferase family 2 protein [Candidatus Scalindua sp.]|jgi:dolichol-phosphate mannosyltransferase|nr:glycosyltransferase family 2 protein [Candidatus Scalindua sp.]MBT5307639.1 glycosyltransferase family 2 protein [Candidatus Scalindua sp.]MBT6227357.1 glycosyltransferase family 2 protein [Candidatus Scalindua sp.]MBT6563681.1 glycosyltransferase family 2 protein [Candidatus Scalindua sp.]MBT7211033.1 glycosyltransferase family 2 protein [Candidatus Scalindua sp.]
MNTLIALPAFNEKKEIGVIISQIKKYDLDILVIDDGSTDGTQEELSNIEYINTIVHEKNLGYGQTIIDAFKYGISNGYESIITMDCDGQHIPDEVQIFLTQISNYDIVSGSRYLIQANKSDPQIPPDRYAINMEINQILSETIKLNLTDSFCGFKAYKTEAIKKMNLTEKGYGMPLQLWMQAWKLGLSIKEIPVELIYNNADKRFNGNLDNPTIRLNYYKEIINREMSEHLRNQVAV